MLTNGGFATDADGTLSGCWAEQDRYRHLFADRRHALRRNCPHWGALVFTPTAHQVAPGSTITTGMTLSVNDGIVGSPTTDTVTTVVATAVNDTPAITGTAAGQTVNDGRHAASVLVCWCQRPDASASETVTIVLTNGGFATDADGTLSGSGLTKTGTGIYSLGRRHALCRHHGAGCTDLHADRASGGAGQHDHHRHDFVGHRQPCYLADDRHRDACHQQRRSTTRLRSAAPKRTRR